MLCFCFVAGTSMSRWALNARCTEYCVMLYYVLCNMLHPTPWYYIIYHMSYINVCCVDCCLCYILCYNMLHVTLWYHIINDLLEYVVHSVSDLILCYDIILCIIRYTCVQDAVFLVHYHHQHASLRFQRFLCRLVCSVLLCFVML